MESMAQIDIGLSKPFGIVRFKNIIYKQKQLSRKLSPPNMFKSRPQTIFGSEFYSIPTQNTSPRSPETSELSENLQLQLKSTPIFPQKCNKSTDRSRNPPSVGILVGLPEIWKR